MRFGFFSSLCFFVFKMGDRKQHETYTFVYEIGEPKNRKMLERKIIIRMKRNGNGNAFTHLCLVHIRVDLSLWSNMIWYFIGKTRVRHVIIMLSQHSQVHWTDLLAYLLVWLPGGAWYDPFVWFKHQLSIAISKNTFYFIRIMDPNSNWFDLIALKAVK